MCFDSDPTARCTLHLARRSLLLPRVICFLFFVLGVPAWLSFQVNCPFFYKIGACRHGDRCSRQHHKPPFSQTILVQNLYQNPVSAVMAAGGDPAHLPKDHVQDDVSVEPIATALIRDLTPGEV